MAEQTAKYVKASNDEALQKEREEQEGQLIGADMNKFIGHVFAMKEINEKDYKITVKDHYNAKLDFKVQKTEETQ